MDHDTMIYLSLVANKAIMILGPFASQPVKGFCAALLIMIPSLAI